MYLYVDRLLLLFCVLLAVFLCAVLLILADYLAWVAVAAQNFCQRFSK